MLSKLLSDSGDNRHLGLGKCISKPVASSLGKQALIIEHQVPVISMLIPFANQQWGTSCEAPDLS
jgi:hypothetical protein